MKITDLTVLDLRFPTSRDQVGSDAVHVDPDYSAAYVILKTDGVLEGHGLTFTIGRGNEVCAAAIEAFRHLVVSRTLGDITADFGAFWHSLAGESQLRWLGPEKGVVHLALAAIVNAVWDLYAKAERKPVWKLLADMTPEQLVSCIDFHHITDAMTREEALAILDRQAATKAQREAELLRSGYPAYTTSVGWLGYCDEKIHDLCRDGPCRRLDPFQGEGGRASRRRSAAARGRARGDRACPQADDRQQSALGCGRSDRADQRAVELPIVVGRGADASGRRAWARTDCQGHCPGGRRHGRALRRTA